MIKAPRSAVKVIGTKWYHFVGTLTSPAVEILETALGIIPADLAASGTVKFGGVRQMVDQGQQVVVISVSDSGGEFGTISFSSSAGLPGKAG